MDKVYFFDTNVWVNYINLPPHFNVQTRKVLIEKHKPKYRPETNKFIGYVYPNYKCS